MLCVELHAGGQAQALRHGRQHVACRRVVDRAVQRRAWGWREVPVVAALETHGQLQSELLPKEIARPRAQRHHHVVGPQASPIGRAHGPAAVVPLQACGRCGFQLSAQCLQPACVGAHDLARAVHRTRVFHPQGLAEDGPQVRLQVVQFVRRQRGGGHAETGQGLAPESARLEPRLAAVEEQPALVAAAVGDARRVHPPAMQLPRVPDQRVQRAGGFAEGLLARMGQERQTPAPLAQHRQRVVAEARAASAQQARQLRPQPGVVERHERAARQHAGVAVRGGGARTQRVDHGHLHAALAQRERASRAHHAGAQHQHLLSKARLCHASMFPSLVYPTRSLSP